MAAWTLALGVFTSSSGCTVASSASESLSVVSNSLWSNGLHSPWNLLGQNTRVGSHSLLQGIVYQLSHKGIPSILKWVVTEKLFLSPGDLPNPGIEPGSPVLQVDSLPTELSGNAMALISHFCTQGSVCLDGSPSKCIHIFAVRLRLCHHLSRTSSPTTQVKVFCCWSVTQSCPTLCDPMVCSMPGFPVLHYLPEIVFSSPKFLPFSSLLLAKVSYFTCLSQYFCFLLPLEFRLH